MKYRYFLLYIIVLLPFISRGQATGSIRVTITGIEHENGTLYVGLFSEDDDFLKEASFEKDFPVLKKKEFHVHFENIPCGIYAISVYHDLDDNEKLDANFIGIPSEPVGFSNDYQPKMGPPKFKNAKFNLNQKNIELTINMYTY
jgi:uncharacterized protein (DUF2141 family)